MNAVHNGAEQVIPLSHLSLDHAEPVVGWDAAFQARGVELLEDDLGRVCVRREDARSLIAERREEERARRARAVQPVQEMALPVGIPALPNGSPYEALAAAGAIVTPQQEFGTGRRSVFEELLERELAEGQRREALAKAEAVDRARATLEGRNK